MVPATGMALFFTLSGYLITTFLSRRPDPKAFMIRRLLRIVPLAWTVMAVILVCTRASLGEWVAVLGFALNYARQYMTEYDSHFWSVCAEMHFYVVAALLVALGGRRALFFLPVLCLIVTAARIHAGATISTHTHLRVDEILAGATLALVFENRFQPALNLLMKVPPWLWILALLASAHPFTGPFMYLRPYFGGLLVGSTLAQPKHALSVWLGNKPLKYLAEISYALYMIHGPLRAGWFGEGSTLVKYAFKRPLTLGITFALAHFSTRHFESRFIELGKRLTRRPARADVTSAPA